MVTQAAASVIGRVCAQATAGEIFCERVYAEMREYLGEVRNAVAQQSATDVAAIGWQCHLCPFKQLVRRQDLLRHVEKQHQGGMKHPIFNFAAFARHLFDTCTKKPAPWDLFQPAGAGSVWLPNDRNWKNLVRDRPLAEAAALVRFWNQGKMPLYVTGCMLAAARTRQQGSLEVNCY